MHFKTHADGSLQVTLEWLKSKRQGDRYRFFIFLNSSVRGPYVPAYMPPGWQWTRAFTDRLGGPGDVRGVSSSLVCLPEVDAGGRGPRMESWAFALDQIGQSLQISSCQCCYRFPYCQFEHLFLMCALPDVRTVPFITNPLRESDSVLSLS